jgi:hypothetical protein
VCRVEETLDTTSKPTNTASVKMEMMATAFIT